MTKPSERIVVFVTPAQKRAIAAAAEQHGISVSELMRRAVLSFDATSEQVKAASIVDRLNAPRAPDALDAALRRVAHHTARDAAHDTAHGTVHGSASERAALPAALRARASGEAQPLADASANANIDADTAPFAAASSTARESRMPAPAGQAPADSMPGASAPAPLLPADVLAALTTEVDANAVATAEAVARIAAARAAASGSPAPVTASTQSRMKSVFGRPRLDTTPEDDEPQGDLGTEGGRFA
ncbi:hypothetical protein EN871_19050 [bacterium M00.F.Ca.ET.228.01.1.1]|uniref:plasmid mobilization protein n=1 Tax=Paraburkholderia phenoliruptrix TaxID=252970 RepID=UPI001091ED20|nr:hypothetical protein [Paraburkholderia phenoliruptrix]TGP42294.1 hypothetical protein EN871_19050 [bacterium M00.F.Ca.ET.228.01.1.1]TGR99943.1 hypothetical protein EN834_17235 [bacterium M00.F.Ca.ET.191.01.1.1]TGU04264.1 hypothetical protein EN798_18055 [bacterium M00.F.Ca.ET.155.01.1.1]MBW0448614.1 hypothetical protein [Paraburkholderia phenoliruptrix]MBW9100524.1 hypothetical protein [Paraburkholderia phenoliruptrix]